MKPINRTQHIRYGHKFTVSLPHYMDTRYEVATPQGIEPVGNPVVVWRKNARKILKPRAKFTFMGYRNGTIKIISHYLDKPDLVRRPMHLKVKGSLPDYPNP